MCAAGALFLGPDIRDLCILGVQGRLLVEGMMSTVHRSARAHCFANRPVTRAACWMTLSPSAIGLDRTQ
jgi:hypothetical protein